MRLIRFNSLLMIAVFTTVSLLGETPAVVAKMGGVPFLGEVRADQEQQDEDFPEELEEGVPEEEAVALPQPYSPNVAEVVVPTVPDKKTEDQKTDNFLKGAFCVISALFFIASYIIVKSNEGQSV